MTFTTRPTLRGTFGMVSSTHWLASQVAMAELEAGGNAFDAAVAGAFVLHIVEPHLNGPGGDLVAIIAPGGSDPVVLCGQGPAPKAATIEHYRGLGLDLIPGAGPLATAVPGAVNAWLTLLRDHGTRPLRHVLDYAIGYAAGGHPIVPRLRDVIVRVQDLFVEHWPTSAEQWLPGGRPPTAHSLVRNHAWALTLERIIAEAELASADRDAQIDAALAAWREGFVASAIEDFARKPYRDSSGDDHAGVITADDLAGFQATYERPVTADVLGHTIAKAGPWTQGPVLLQTLLLLEDIDADPGTPDGIHAVAEAMKLAYADRDAWYGDDPDVPLDTLLSEPYTMGRRALIACTPSAELRPGSPGGRAPRLPRHVLHPMITAPGHDGGDPTVPRYEGQRGDTCHIDVVDRWDNMISATPSGGWLQSSPYIPDLGFCLGSRLQMCWLEEGLPASLRPGRRPRTTLTPSLVLRDGRAVLACGSPGGDQQDQWQLLFLLRHLAGDMDLQEAIDAPMWHTTAVPGSFYPRDRTPLGLVAEERLGQSVLCALRDRGHEVTVSAPWSLGRMCATAREPESGTLSAGANPRGMQGYAVGR